MTSPFRLAPRRAFGAVLAKTLISPCLIGGSSLALAAALGAAKNSLPTSGSHETSLDLSQYRLAFSDDFHRMDISANGPGTTWIAHTPWGGDFGDARFADPGAGGPFSISKDGLRVEAKKDGKGSWQSGLIASVDRKGRGFAQEYGYFEMRAKLPPGKGLWPAFWLNAVVPENSNESGIEVDALEYYGQFPSAYRATVHVWPRPKDANEATRTSVIDVPFGSLYSTFHTYGVDVSPTWITVYLDRIAKWRSPTPSQHHSKLMILADLAMGSGWPINETPNPSVMQINYIRAYRKAGPL